MQTNKAVYQIAYNVYVLDPLHPAPWKSSGSGFFFTLSPEYVMMIFYQNGPMFTLLFWMHVFKSDIMPDTMPFLYATSITATIFALASSCQIPWTLQANRFLLFFHVQVFKVQRFSFVAYSDRTNDRMKTDEDCMENKTSSPHRDGRKNTENILACLSCFEFHSVYLVM